MIVIVAYICILLKAIPLFYRNFILRYLLADRKRMRTGKVREKTHLIFIRICQTELSILLSYASALKEGEKKEREEKKTFCMKFQNLFSRKIKKKIIIKKILSTAEYDNSA